MEARFPEIYAVIDRGDLPGALAMLEATQRHAQDREDPDYRAAYGQTLARILDLMGRSSDALAPAEEAVAIALRHWPETERAAVCLRTLLIVLERLGRDDEAANIERQLFALGERLDDRVLVMAAEASAARR